MLIKNKIDISIEYNDGGTIFFPATSITFDIQDQDWGILEINIVTDNCEAMRNMLELLLSKGLFRAAGGEYLVTYGGFYKAVEFTTTISIGQDTTNKLIFNNCLSGNSVDFQSYHSTIELSILVRGRLSN